MRFRAETHAALCVLEMGDHPYRVDCPISRTPVQGHPGVIKLPTIPHRQKPLRHARELVISSTACHQAGIGVIMELGARAFSQRRARARRIRGHRLFTSTWTPGQGEHQYSGHAHLMLAEMTVRNFLIGNGGLFGLVPIYIDGYAWMRSALLLYLDYSRKTGSGSESLTGGERNLDAIYF